MVRLPLILRSFQIVYIIFQHNSCYADNSRICPELRAQLAKSGKANVVVSFQNGIMSTLESITAVRYGSRDLQNTAIKEALQDNADISQATVLQILSTRSSTESDFLYFKQYWSSNKIFIREASAAVINELSEDPEVKLIKKEPFVQIPELGDPTTSEEEFETEDDYGEDEIKMDDELTPQLRIIQVQEAWDILEGNKGEGVIVGTIDTGVRHTHEALISNFIGIDYGWFDAVNNKTEPYDDDGHGTHVLGTLAGSHGIGVAPGSRWMTCLACNNGWCPGEALLDCIQWMSCPTLPDGTNEDCSKAPHVINNSWTTERNVDDFNEDIMRWRAMGIIPIFSIGNGGPQCRTSVSPGEKSFVIGVGASNKMDEHWSRSCVGPAPDGTIKPDLLAPGTSVSSAWHSSDTFYYRQTGTSMSSPHVSGVVALLRVRDPELTYEQAYKFLTENTDRNITVFVNALHRYCNESSFDVFPNIFFGYGRLNAFKAIQAQTLLLNEM